MLSVASLTKGMKIYQSVIEFILADGNQSTKSLHAKYKDFEVQLGISITRIERIDLTRLTEPKARC